MIGRISLKKFEGILKVLGMNYQKGGKEWIVIYRNKPIVTMSIRMNDKDQAVHPDALRDIFRQKLVFDGFNPNRREFSEEFKKLKKQFR